ncbi:MAG TPA: hypothetical protein EYH43_05465 [Persephonella sp.]|nr:hypothetical protein [Hydrogenothermaceae bacterium]HIQ25412.1 hypothetical protein [Persephonella sp.]
MGFLNLENFDEDKQNQSQEEECKEYKEKIQFLQNQIRSIKKEYEQKLSEEVSKLKNEIYKNLQQDFQNQLAEKIKQVEKELLEKYEREYQKKLEKAINQKEYEIKNQYQKFCKELENNLFLKIKDYKIFIEEKFLESLEIIFDVLSLDKNTLPIVKQEIEKLLEDFNSYTPIKIKINPVLADTITFNHIKVEPDENLNPFDFEIEFENFKVEKNYKEILQQVIDEIRREIKTD